MFSLELLTIDDYSDYSLNFWIHLDSNLASRKNHLNSGCETHLTFHDPGLVNKDSSSGLAVLLKNPGRCEHGQYE